MLLKTHVAFFMKVTVKIENIYDGQKYLAQTKKI
jgi:hypothetical protein